MEKDFSYAEKIAALAVVICPLCEPYRMFGLSMDFLLIIVSSLLVVFASLSQGFKFFLPRPLLLFTLYGLTIPVYFGITGGYAKDAFGELKTILVFVLGLAFILPYLRFDLLRKYYKIIVIFVSFIFLIQLLFALMGRPFSALIPFFELKYETTDMASFIEGQKSQNRFSSMFLEPSHFAQYLLPMLVIQFGNCFNLKKYYNAASVFLLLMLLLIRSGVGLILGALSWFIMLLGAHVSKSRKVWILTLAILSILIFVPLYLNSDIGSEVAGRTSEITYSEDANTSGSKRIWNGYFAYSDLPFKYKITGVSSDGLESAMDNSQFSFLFDYSKFLNNIHILLIGYGLIGFLLFFSFLISLYKKNIDIGRGILILFTLLCFMEGFFFTGKMFFWLGIIMCCSEHVSSVVSKDKKYLNHPHHIQVFG